MKGTTGQPWRRTPVAGNHWYLSWAPGGAAGLDLPAGRTVWVRALRHHDETGNALPPGSPADYEDVAAEALDPRTGAQREAATAGPGSVVQIVGPPGSGKTATLLFATRSPAARALFITSTPALASAAKRFFTASHAHGVEVVTLRDLAGRISGHPTPRSDLASFLAAAEGPLRPLLGPWLGHERALWAELRGVVLGLPLSFPWSRGACPIPPGELLDADTYAAISDLPEVARAAALGIAKVAIEYGWLADLRATRGAAAALGDAAPEWTHVDLIAVDEAQDLTPVDLALIVDLGRTKPGQRPTLYLAGDESQTLLPTAFDWGAVGDLVFQRLGAHASKHVLATQLRQPAAHAALVAAAASLYRIVEKPLRPHVVAADEASEVDGKILVVDAPAPPTLDVALEAQPGQIAVYLTDPPAPSATTFTPEEIKGLDRRTVVLPDFPAHVAHLRSLVAAAEARGDVIAGREARREIDRLRVALSRSTDQLILWGRGVEEALAFLGVSTSLTRRADAQEALKSFEKPQEDGAWARLEEAAELLDRGDAARGAALLDMARAEGRGTALEEEVAAIVGSRPTHVRVPPGDTAALVEALANVESGGTVELLGGTYSPGTLWIRRDVTLKGVNDASLLSSSAECLLHAIDAKLRLASLRLVLDGAPRRVGAVVSVLRGSLDIDGCTLRGPAVPTLVLLKASATVIRGAGFEDARDLGIHATEGSSCAVDSCTFRGVPVAIHAAFAASLSIRRSHFEGLDYGVQFGGTPGECVKNHFVDITNASVMIGGESSDVLVEANQILRGGTGVAVSDRARARLVKNKLRDTQGPSIDQTSGSRVEASENVITTPREVGIRVLGPSRGSYSGDRVTGGLVGLGVEHGGEVEVRKAHISGPRSACVSVLDATVTVSHSVLAQARVCAVHATGEAAKVEVVGGEVEKSGQMGISATNGARIVLRQVKLRHNGHGEVSASLGGILTAHDSELTAKPDAIAAFANDSGHVALHDCKLSGDRAAISVSARSTAEAVRCHLVSKKFCIHLMGSSSAKLEDTTIFVPRRGVAMVEPGSTLEKGNLRQLWKGR